MFAHAFFRLESAGTVALTILLIYFVPQPFPWWQWWFWLVIALVAEALIVYTSVSDEDTGAQVVADMLREQYDPAHIHSPKYRAAVERALDYRTRIQDVIRRSERGVLQAHLKESTSGISDWIAQIFRLARRLDDFDGDVMIKQDLQSVPGTIQELGRRAASEPDPAVRDQARQVLASRQEQWQNLQKLVSTMDSAGLQLEATLTALGTVYSQLVLIRSKDDIEDSRAQRLRGDIADQVKKLNALQDAMDEVYKSDK